MMNLVPLDKVLEFVRNIVDNVRCPICDKLEGRRGRYSCGHTVCDECMTVAEECEFCLTPPIIQGHSKPKLDEPLSERAVNACRLLKYCEETFHTDVYKRLRVSEQLKIEKEVFPECIQAPLKYYNKRKSCFNESDKENRSSSILPGERTSSPKVAKMKKSSNVVQQWLNKTEPFSRRALSDLNVNHQSYDNRNEKFLNRKRQHSFSPSRKKANKIVRSNSKRKINKIAQTNTLLVSKDQVKCEHEESGIVLDDEPIYIEDSQSQIIDKDQLALLAVADADKETSISLKSLEYPQEIDMLPCDDKTGEKCLTDILKENNNTPRVNKVPFYKRSSIVETCLHCEGKTDNLGNSIVNDSQNVSISIENSNFFTTINIYDCNSTFVSKNTVLIQTDISDMASHSTEKRNNTDLVTTSKVNDIKFIEDIKKSTIQQKSQDLFTDDVECESNKIHGDNLQAYKSIRNMIPQKGLGKMPLKCEEQFPKKCNVIINDSDSDTIIEEASYLHVSADVHRSDDSVGHGILDEISIKKFECRSKKKLRGGTPDSSNSSEKENWDPNRSKNQKNNKKNKSFK